MSIKSYYVGAPKKNEEKIVSTLQQVFTAALIHNRQDAKQYLEQLVELLQDSAAGHTQPKGSKTSSTSAPSGGAQALTVACGNLGVVCHELGDAEQASSLLQASLRFSLFAAAESVRYWVLYGVNMCGVGC